MSIYFLILSPLIIISCLLIITSKNSITSVLYLILVFILNSLCFLLLGAEFLSILIIIIYIGAISILFLFVIMMLNLRIVEVYNTLISYFPIASFLSIFFFF
jgi:NADH-quinone oxidoreductase subunit J